jgi:DNA-binding NarL/FixJ family response regulator
LQITRATVSTYLRTIYSKLGVTSRTGAIRQGLDQKLIE